MFEPDTLVDLLSKAVSNLYVKETPKVNQNTLHSINTCSLNTETEYL